MIKSDSPHTADRLNELAAFTDVPISETHRRACREAAAIITELREAVATMTGTEWAGIGRFRSWQDADESLGKIKAKIDAALKDHRKGPPGFDPARWLLIETAPHNGEHILACIAGTSFGFVGKRWPAIQTVVHWWANPGEEGFYTSVNEMEPQRPFGATHWKPLDEPEGTF